MFLLAEFVDFLCGPDADSFLVRLLTICSAILLGVVFSVASREVTSMTPEELAHNTHQAQARARWWEVALAGAIAGSWAYVLLVTSGRFLELGGLVSFPLPTQVMTYFAVAAIAAAIAGALWWARSPKSTTARPD